ncbi:enoyl-CoA hydratase/isomerase family protein [Sporosarcina limicola]|nr:enoyl-CoA hydratase/isomerase family protein [Sporosarcina limicola]
MTQEVLFSINNHRVGTILLNRPKALNSLSLEMVQAIGVKLSDWTTNDRVKIVIIKGAGSKGLCAGGDIKTLYGAKDNEECLQKANTFFTEEYQTDLAIAQFPKPIIACLDGIVMGGGVGLTYGASTRLVTERTIWAMPELAIGFFPDVGAAYFLNKAPGFIGRYLALTAMQLKAEDVLYINGADHFIQHEKLILLLHELEESQTETTIDTLLEQYTTPAPNEGSLVRLQKEIDDHFSFTTVEEILDSLEKSDTPFALETKETMLAKSAISLKVTLKQLIEGEQKTLEECLATDLILAKNFMKHEDFFEGVRSVLIDKDLKPNYKYPHISSITDDMINQFFIS